MDRIYASGAAGSAPVAPGSPSTGYPTAGNPSSGTPATKPGPYWYHMVMEELMAIINAAGITPAHGNLTQLLTALTELMPQYSDQTGLLSANGWVSIPLKIAGVKRKLIIQWGTASISGLGGSSFTYPITFPNAVFALIGTVNDGSATSVFSTAFVTGAPKVSGSFRLSDSSTRTVAWCAIGW